MLVFLFLFLHKVYDVTAYLILGNFDAWLELLKHTCKVANISRSEQNCE